MVELTKVCPSTQSFHPTSVTARKNTKHCSVSLFATLLPRFPRPHCGATPRRPRWWPSPTGRGTAARVTRCWSQRRRSQSLGAAKLTGLARGGDEVRGFVPDEKQGLKKVDLKCSDLQMISFDLQMNLFQRTSYGIWADKGSKERLAKSAVDAYMRWLMNI